MRSLCISALRLFILIEIIQSLITIIAMLSYGFSSEYNEFLNVPSLSFAGSLVLYALVFWKAAWIVDKSRIVMVDEFKITVNAKAVVAGGLILFGVFGIVEQLMQSLSFFNYFFGGQFTSPPPSFGPGKTFLSAAFLLIRLLVYTFCIFGASRISELVTKRFSTET
ncbi:MAG TPA: hypothetical protein VHP63_03180 [candidate division Zixibacteria bacterium]|nr:hypothetical protein [candidate division Zixibacteria bacterium]